MGLTMKTNYSLSRIEQLELILLKLGYRKRDKHGLTKKEANLYNKLMVCVCSQKKHLALVHKLI